MTTFYEDFRHNVSSKSVDDVLPNTTSSTTVDEDDAEEKLTEEELKKLPPGVINLMCEGKGLDTKGTKKQRIARLIDDQERMEKASWIKIQEKLPGTLTGVEKIIYRAKVVPKPNAADLANIDRHGFREGLLIKGCYAKVPFCEPVAYGTKVVALVCERSEGEANANLRREAKLLSELKHDNIVKTLAIPHKSTTFELEGWKNQYFAAFVEEIRPLGYDLDQFYRNFTTDLHTIPRELILSLIFQLIDAVSYLQQKGVVHRDIKPGNIVIEDPLGLKLIDFGLATIGNDQGQINEVVSTYAAPEVNVTPTPFSVDVWGIGVIFFFLLTGNTVDRNHAEKQIKIKQANDSLGRQLQHLLVDAESRWDIKQLREDMPAMQEDKPEIPPPISKWYCSTGTLEVFRVLLPESFETIKVADLQLPKYGCRIIKTDGPDGVNVNLKWNTPLKAGMYVSLGIKRDITEESFRKVWNDWKMQEQYDEMSEEQFKYRKDTGDTYYQFLKVIGKMPAYKCWATVPQPKFLVFDFPKNCFGRTLLGMNFNFNFEIPLAGIAREDGTIVWWPGADDKIQPDDKGLVYTDMEITPAITVDKLQKLKSYDFEEEIAKKAKKVAEDASKEEIAKKAKKVAEDASKEPSAVSPEREVPPPSSLTPEPLSPPKGNERQLLQKMKISELRKTAVKKGLNDVDIDKALDEDDPKSALIDLIAGSNAES